MNTCFCCRRLFSARAGRAARYCVWDAQGLREEDQTCGRTSMSVPLPESLAPFITRRASCGGRMGERVVRRSFPQVRPQRESAGGGRLLQRPTDCHRPPLHRRPPPPLRRRGRGALRLGRPVTVRTRSGHSSGLGVSPGASTLHGTFGWGRAALDGQERRVPDRVPMTLTSSIRLIG